MKDKDCLRTFGLQTHLAPNFPSSPWPLNSLQRGFTEVLISQRFLPLVEWKKLQEVFFLHLLILISLHLKIILMSRWYILGWPILIPFVDTELLKIPLKRRLLGISQVIKVFCTGWWEVLAEGPRGTFQREAGLQKRLLRPSAAPTDFWGQERAGDKSSITDCHWFNQPCPCNEISIKSPKQRGSGIFRVGKNNEVPGGWRAFRGCGSFKPLPQTLPCASLPSGSSWVVSFVIKQS